MDLALRSNIMNPLVFCLKPKNVEVAALGSSFFLLAARVLEKHKYPNNLKDSIS